MNLLSTNKSLYIIIVALGGQWPTGHTFTPGDIPQIHKL